MNEQLALSRNLIRSALADAKNPGIAFSGGKKSVLLLHLARHECKVPLKVICVRTDNEHEKLVHFTEKIRRLWRLDLIAERSDGDSQPDPILCCRPAIAGVLKQAVEKYKLDAILLGNNSEDRHPVIMDEALHSFFNPIQHITGGEIRSLIAKLGLPLCSLYEEGYEKLDCRLCTYAPPSGPSHSSAEDEEIIKTKMKRLGYI
jgi:phosphoadenosine phosphosulfate reductase